MPAAQLILLCLMADQQFLEDQDRRFQMVIATSSVAICWLHPDPTSLIAIFTNPNDFAAVAKFKSRLIANQRRLVSDR
jgi:hypothetical protein